MRYSDGRTLTPADANHFGWQVQWSAVTGRYDIVTQAYSFNGQRIAQRKDGVLTYLHADQVGSTLLATDASGAVVGGNQPRYFAYGRERTPSLAALPTDYTYTGQKQDGSGLVYMNARYYDPVIGQFISPDSLVPDPTYLFSYNRFMYVNGNPLRYNDPSGHASPTTGALPQPDTWQAALDAIKLVAQQGAAIVGPILAAAPPVTTAAVVLGGGAYGLANTTDALPSVPALYPNLGVGNGNISITIPVPGSTTMTSGVPLTPGAQTQSTGATAVNQPAQQLVEPLPAQQQGGNILYAKPLTNDERGHIRRINSIPDFLNKHPDLPNDARIVNNGGQLPARSNHVLEAQQQIAMLENAIYRLQLVYRSRTPDAQQEINDAINLANQYIEQLNNALSTK